MANLADAVDGIAPSHKWDAAVPGSRGVFPGPMRPAEHPSEDGEPGRDSAGPSAECSKVASRNVAPA